MNTPPIIKRPAHDLPPAKKPFAFQAAQASVLAPLVAIGVNVVLNAALGTQASSTVKIVIGSLSTALIALGFIFAIIGLWGVRRYGKTGFLWLAITGLLINGLILAVESWVAFNLK